MKINVGNLKPAEFARNVFAATPDHGTVFEDILKPEYWAHVASKLHPTDRIELVAEDGSWFAELIVTAAARNWASVSVLRYVEISEAAKPAAKTAQFEVAFKGQKLLHAVIRKSDKEIVKSGFAKAGEAAKWLEQYESSMLV